MALTWIFQQSGTFKSQEIIAVNNVAAQVINKDVIELNHFK